MACRRRLWPLVLLLLPSCFVELGGGYYPSVRQTVTDMGTSTQSSGTGWTASIKLGFFADIVSEKRGVAFGWGPVGTDLVIARSPNRAHAGDGHMFRADYVLGPQLLQNPVFRPRIVGEFDYYTDASVRRPGETSYTDRNSGGGHRMFLGVGIGHTADYGSQILAVGIDRNSLHTPEYFSKVVGEGHDPAVETSAWGMSASLTISFLPADHPNGITNYVHDTIHTSPGATACDSWSCDRETGVCTRTCYR